MNKYYLSLFVFLLLLCAARANAQDNAHGSVVLHTDPRMAVLFKKNHVVVPVVAPAPVRPPEAPPKLPALTSAHAPVLTSLPKEGARYTGKGYRVQIYNGPERDKAIAAKTEFMRHFPGLHTYLIYLSPNFKVKVGDYRYRSDAEGMLKEANSMYSPCMIVPDVVTVNGN